MKFKNRIDAGHQLAKLLKAYHRKPDTILLAIPRGGVEIGYTLSHELKLPLDIILTKKIGSPLNPEYAIGCVSLNESFIEPAYEKTLSEKWLQQTIASIKNTLLQREKEYRQEKTPLNLKDKTVIIVDDGIATGKTLFMTLRLIKKQLPKKIIIAVPVSAPEPLVIFKKEVDELYCSLAPQDFYAVGQFYKEFNQVDDASVIHLLKESYGHSS